MGSQGGKGEAIIHLLFILIVGAAIGFVVLDGASKVDAIYLALSTVTTVGFGDVYPKSPAAKLLSVCVQISGIGLCSHAVVHFGNWHSRILGKRPTLTSCALVLSVVVTSGAFLLMLVEGMSLGDAVYLAVVASTSVGYGDLTPVTSAGKFGCMLFVLVSLVPVAVVSGAVADSLLSALGGELTSGDEVSQPSSSREDKPLHVDVENGITVENFFVDLTSAPAFHEALDRVPVAGCTMQSSQANDDANAMKSLSSSSHAEGQPEALEGASESPPSLCGLQRGTSLGSLQSGSLGSGSSRGSSELYVYGAAQPMSDAERHTLYLEMVANFDEMSPLLRPPEVLAARPSTLDEFFDLESRIQRGELGEQALAHFEDFQAAIYAPREGSGGALSHESLVGLSDATNASLTVWATQTPGGPQQQQGSGASSTVYKDPTSLGSDNSLSPSPAATNANHTFFHTPAGELGQSPSFGSASVASMNLSGTMRAEMELAEAQAWAAEAAAKAATAHARAAEAAGVTQPINDQNNKKKASSSSSSSGFNESSPHTNGHNEAVTSAAAASSSRGTDNNKSSPVSTEAATAAAQAAVAEAQAIARVKEATALAAAGRAAAASETVERVQERAQARQRQREQCSAYKVDLSAAAFGQCVCGQPKSEHSEAALKHKKQTLPSSSTANEPTSPEDRASVESAMATADALAQEASSAQAESDAAAAVLAKAQLALRSAMEKRSSSPSDEADSISVEEDDVATAAATPRDEDADDNEGEAAAASAAAAQRALELQSLAEEAQKEATAAAEAAKVLEEAMKSSPVLPMNVVQRIIRSNNNSPQVPSSSSAKTLSSGSGRSSTNSPAIASGPSSNKKHGLSMASDLAAEAYPTPPPRISIPSSQRSFSPSAAGVVHFPSPLRKKLLSNVANVFARSEHAASALALAHSQRHSSSLADSEASAQGTTPAVVVSGAASEIAQWWRSVTAARAEATCTAKEEVAMSREVRVKQSDRWSMEEEKAHSAAESIRALIEGKGYESPRKTALSSRVEALAAQEEANERLKKDKASKTNAIRQWLSAQQQQEQEPLSEPRNSSHEGGSVIGNEGMSSLLAAAVTYPPNARALGMTTSNSNAAPTSPASGGDQHAHTASRTTTPSASVASSTPKSTSKRTQLYEVATALYEASLTADVLPEDEEKNQGEDQGASTIVAPPNTPYASRNDNEDGSASIASKMRGGDEDEEDDHDDKEKNENELLKSPNLLPVPPLIMSPNINHPQGGGEYKRPPLPSPTTLLAGGHELRRSSSGSFQREVSSPLSPAAVAAAAAAAAVLDQLPPPPVAVAAALAAHANPHVQTDTGGAKISIYDFINGCEITAQAATTSSSSASPSSSSPIKQGGGAQSPLHAKDENDSPGSNSSRNLYARLAEAEEQAQNEMLEASSLPATPNIQNNSRSVFSTDDEEDRDDGDGNSVYSSPLINQHSHASAGATPARTPTSANNNKSGTISIRAMMAMLANQATPSPVVPSSEESGEGGGSQSGAVVPSSSSSRTRGVRWQDQEEEERGNGQVKGGPKDQTSNETSANATNGAFYVLDSNTNDDDDNYDDSVISTSDFVQLLQANAIGIEEFSEGQTTEAATEEEGASKEDAARSTSPHTPAVKKTPSSLARASTPRERASEAMRANLEAAGFFPNDNEKATDAKVEENGGKDDDEVHLQGHPHTQDGFVRLTLWSSKDLSALVASLGPARDYAVLAKKIRKSGLDGLSLRDAYGIAALDVLLYELGWQQPEDVHPLLRHKLHGVLEKLLADGGGVPPPRTSTTSSSGKISAHNEEEGDGVELEPSSNGGGNDDELVGQAVSTELQRKKRCRRRESWREIQAAQAAAEAEVAAKKSLQRSERDALRAIGRQPKATTHNRSHKHSKPNKMQKEELQSILVLSPKLSGMLQKFV